MKILVTGANGFLGRGITKKLLDLGAEVVATDFTVDSIDPRAQLVQTDLFTVENPFSFFGNPDVVLHLAWRNGFIHNAPSHLEDLPKHFDFLSKMVNSGITKLSVMGTMHEIGFFEGSISDSTPCAPMTAYGVAKNALRQMFFSSFSTSSTSLQWLRAFYIVSNDPRGSSIFSKLIQASERGDERFPFTSGFNQYDFLDYEVFCNYVALATLDLDCKGIINVCSGYPESLSDRVERFIEENNLSIKLDYGAFPDRPYDSKAVWGDSSAIQSVVGSSFVRRKR